jgi:hypothetical protein
MRTRRVADHCTADPALPLRVLCVAREELLWRPTTRRNECFPGAASHPALGRTSTTARIVTSDDTVCGWCYNRRVGIEHAARINASERRGAG